jgi:hypothetical protein
MKSQELLKAINSDLNAIQSLMKSYSMKALEKNEDEEIEPQVSPEAEVSPEVAPEVAPEDEANPEAQDEGFDFSSASNEELLSMLEELMQIVEQRLGGEEGQQPAEEESLGEPLAMAEGDEGEVSEIPQADEGEVSDIGEPTDVEGMEQPAESPEVADGMGGEGEIEVDESPEALQQEIAALEPEDFQKLKEAVDAVAGQSAPEMAKALPMKKALVPFKKALPKVAGLKPVKGGSHNGSAPKKSDLVKSLNDLCDNLEKMAQKVKEPQGTPSAKFADANLRILEKSASAAPEMDGPTLANWLLTEQRKGNKLVKSLHVASANCAKTQESLSEVYNTIKAAGIVLP